MRRLEQETVPSEETDQSLILISKSSIRVPDEPAPVLRLRAVLAELTSFVASKGSGKQKRMAFVLRRVATDICEEMGEADADTIAAYFNQMGQVVSWIGTGDNNNLPEQLRDMFLPRAEGIQRAIEGTIRRCANCGKETDVSEPVCTCGISKDVVTIPDGVDTELSGADTRTR